jgi:hypothetical protein
LDLHERGFCFGAKMPRKKKPKFKVATEARRRARLGIGPPPAERTIPDKRSKPVKHKKEITETEEA